jgi:hypothetical protein
MDGHASKRRGHHNCSVPVPIDTTLHRLSDPRAGRDGLLNSQNAVASPQIAGVLLVSCFVVFTVGGLMFAGRNGMAGRPAPNFAYLAVERSFVIAAVVLTALGLVAFAEIIGQAHHGALNAARLTAAIYVIAAIPLVISEVNLLRNGHQPYPLVVFYVAVALIAEAALGIILIRTGFLPAWVGWTAVCWNLACLAVLPIATPHNIYFPALHHVIPLVIGIVLLRQG